MHEAELDSAIASIWILPPGQVTETSFSPGLQMSSHLVLHAGWKSACRLVVPAGPAGPGGPGGPSGPTPPPAPSGPRRPGGPGGPAGPGGPVRPAPAPAGPAGPGGPAGPCGPCGPSKQPAIEKPSTSPMTATEKRIAILPLPGCYFRQKSLSDPTPVARRIDFAMPIGAVPVSEAPRPLRRRLLLRLIASPRVLLTRHTSRQNRPIGENSTIGLVVATMTTVVRITLKRQQKGSA